MVILEMTKLTETMALEVTLVPELYLKLKWNVILMLYGYLNAVIQWNYGLEYYAPCLIEIKIVNGRKHSKRRGPLSPHWTRFPTITREK